MPFHAAEQSRHVRADTLSRAARVGLHAASIAVAVFLTASTPTQVAQTRPSYVRDAHRPRGPRAPRGRSPREATEIEQVDLSVSVVRNALTTPPYGGVRRPGRRKKEVCTKHGVVVLRKKKGMTEEKGMRVTRSLMRQRASLDDSFRSVHVLWDFPPSIPPPCLVTHIVPGRCPVVRPTPIGAVSTPAPRS